MRSYVRAPRRPLHHDPRAVRQARIARDLTQTQLAQQLDITQGYLSEIESGTRNAQPDLLDRIAAVLDCPASDLERRRPLGCVKGCAYRYDPQPNGRVPLHTLADGTTWCRGGGQDHG